MKLPAFMNRRIWLKLVSIFEILTYGPSMLI